MLAMYKNLLKVVESFGTANEDHQQQEASTVLKVNTYLPYSIHCSGESSKSAEKL
jgi:hypothetical protein